MSAINPASFVSPVAGVQLPSGLGPGAFNTEQDSYTAHLPQHNDSGFAIAGASNSTHGTFDRLWDTAPSASMASLPFAHVYSQPFQPHDVDNRHLDQLSMDYRTNTQNPATPHSRYQFMPYHFEGLHPSQYATRPTSSNEGPRKAHTHGGDWGQAFQGLSLGS